MLLHVMNIWYSYMFQIYPDTMAGCMAKVYKYSCDTFTCGVCSEVFYHINNFLAHKAKRKNNSSFVTFTRFFSLTVWLVFFCPCWWHLLSVLIDDLAVSVYKCELCHTICSSSSELKNHYIEQHKVIALLISISFVPSGTPLFKYLAQTLKCVLL